MTVITEGWLTEMLGMCQRREVGAVGVNQLYPVDTIQNEDDVKKYLGLHMLAAIPTEKRKSI